MRKPISIVVVDDHPIFRSGLVQLLALEPSFRVVAEGATGSDAPALAAQHQPGLLLLDVTMPENGIDSVAEIRRVSPLTQIVMLTASEQEPDVSRALDAGAVGYVLKGTTGSELIAILHAIHGGQVHVSQRAMRNLISTHRVDSEQAVLAEALSRLSRQEHKVLVLLTKGFNNREIGDQLGIQEKTVKFHLSNVFQKLGVRNRVQAGLLAMRAGVAAL